MSNLDSYINERDKLKENLLKYTRKAFSLIPKINNPDILDIGCGTGLPTIELARLSDGHITGIDIDEGSLEILREKIKDEEINNQLRVLNKSISSLDFKENIFDIIWSEGAVFV